MRFAAEHDAYSRQYDLDPYIDPRAYDPFVQPEVTARFREFLQESSFLLREPRRRLGLVEDAPFQPYVLAIGNIVANHYFDAEGNGLSEAELAAWGKGLKRKTDRFANIVPDGEDLATVGAFSKPKTGDLYIRLADAETLMADKEGYMLGSNGSSTRLVAHYNIRHEFVHTQSDVLVNDTLGVALEEKRAKYFSGDTLSYSGELAIFNFLSSYAQVNINHLFEEVVSARRMGNRDDIYSLLGRELGMASIAEVAAVYPISYISNTTSAPVKIMQQSLGTDREIAARIIRRKFSQQGAQARIEHLYTPKRQLGLPLHLYMRRS